MKNEQALEIINELKTKLNQEYAQSVLKKEFMQIDTSQGIEQAKKMKHLFISHAQKAKGLPEALAVVPGSAEEIKQLAVEKKELIDTIAQNRLQQLQASNLNPKTQEIVRMKKSEAREIINKFKAELSTDYAESVLKKEFIEIDSSQGVEQAKRMKDLFISQAQKAKGLPEAIAIIPGSAEEIKKLAVEKKSLVAKVAQIRLQELQAPNHKPAAQGAVMENKGNISLGKAQKIIRDWIADVQSTFQESELANSFKLATSSQQVDKYKKLLFSSLSKSQKNPELTKALEVELEGTEIIKAVVEGRKKFIEKVANQRLVQLEKAKVQSIDSAATPKSAQLNDLCTDCEGILKNIDNHISTDQERHKEVSVVTGRVAEGLRQIQQNSASANRVVSQAIKEVTAIEAKVSDNVLSILLKRLNKGLDTIHEFIKRVSNSHSFFSLSPQDDSAGQNYVPRGPMQ